MHVVLGNYYFSFSRKLGAVAILPHKKMSITERGKAKKLILAKSYLLISGKVCATFSYSKFNETTAKR